MAGLRYNFSKESEPELLEFFKVVANQRSGPVPSELREQWEKVLPMDKEVLKIIESFKASNTIDCVDLTASDEEQVDKTLQGTSRFEQLSMQESTQLNITTTDDITEGVKELLETENILSDDIIKRFARFPQQLEEMFILFATDLSLESIEKLWKSIVVSNCTERDLVACYFSKHILTRKIVTKDNDIQELLKEIMDTFPDVVGLDLANILLEVDVKDLTVIKKHLNVLSDNHRSIVLRHFLKNCTKLEVRHLSSLLQLITKHTDVDNFVGIVELCYNYAKEFSREKMFGKLVIDLMPALGSRIVNLEPQLRYIITNHKSVYQSQATKLFESALNAQTHNLSLSYGRL